MFIITITEGYHALETYGPFDSEDDAQQFIDNTEWCEDLDWLIHELIAPTFPETTTEATNPVDTSFFYDADWQARIDGCDRCHHDQSCDDHDDWAFCVQCGVWREVDESRSGSSPGYTGAGIDWWAFKGCKHQEVDASADTIEAVR